jgi:hypothetical protein
LFGTVSEPQLRDDSTIASMLLEPSSSSTTVPGIAETQPPAAEHPMPATDVNLSRSDAPPPQLLPIPESNALADDVLLNSLYILKPSLPKCLLLASGDFFTTESSTFLPICQHHRRQVDFQKVFRQHDRHPGQFCIYNRRRYHHVQVDVSHSVPVAAISGPSTPSPVARPGELVVPSLSIMNLSHTSSILTPLIFYHQPNSSLFASQRPTSCSPLKEIQPSAQREALRLCLMSHGRTLVRCTRRTASWTWPSYSLFTDRSLFALWVLTRRWACSLESSGMRKDIIG